MIVFNKFWQAISNLGMTGTLTVANAKRIRLSNQLIFLAIAMTVLYSGVYILWGFSKALIVELTFIGIYSTLLLVSKLGYANISKFLFVLLLNVHMFFLCLCFGQDAQMHLLFIPVAAVPLILFDFKATKTIFSFISFSISVFLLLFLFDFPHALSETLSPILLNTARIFFNITAIVCELIIVYSFISNYDRAEKTLDENNVLLEEQFKSIFDTSFDALFLVDYTDRRIVKANKRAAEMFELKNEAELTNRLGMDFHKEKWDSAKFLSMREELLIKGSFEDEVLYTTAKGNDFWGALAIRVIIIGGKTYQSVRVTDITTQKKVEQQIQSSLHEKEILLSEIHHRVKNNLAVISGLLGLQSAYVEDEKAKRLFEESRNRIHSMALIHDRLYQHETLAKINFNAYINDLIEHIQKSYATSHTPEIKFSIVCNDILLDIKNAVPCGLILNELISNSFKHAFPNKKSGEIKIVCTKMGEKFTMMVSDDGIGYDFENGLKRPHSLGLTLINALSEQVNGKVKTTFENGTAYYISFEA